MSDDFDSFLGQPQAKILLLGTFYKNHTINHEAQVMMQLEQIQAEIERLSQDEFIELRRWFAEKDWEQWDEQLERDAAAGKLDFLLEEAQSAKTKGKYCETSRV